jgi:hypothetical protein
VPQLRRQYRSVTSGPRTSLGQFLAQPGRQIVVLAGRAWTVDRARRPLPSRPLPSRPCPSRACPPRLAHTALPTPPPPPHVRLACVGLLQAASHGRAFQWTLSVVPWLAVNRAPGGARLSRCGGAALPPRPGASGLARAGAESGRSRLPGRPLSREGRCVGARGDRQPSWTG